MCTVSWRLAPERRSYQLWFNRDEQRTRAIAEPPRLHRAGDTSFLCPIDPRGGGTWLSINTHGLTVCLLNNYAAPAPRANGSAPTLSRGALVLAAAPSGNLDAIERLVREPRWQFLPGFHLLALARDGQSRSWLWDCATLVTHENPPAPLTTSSFDSTRIIAERLGVFQKLPARDSAQLAAYHDQHDPARSAESVLMARPDATTVSQSRIEVGPTHTIFHYRAGLGPTMINQPFQTTTLPLR